MFRLLLTVLLLICSAASATKEIGSDAMESDIADKSNLPLSSQDKKKVEAFSLFAAGCLSILEHQEYTDEAIQNLLKSLNNDPKSGYTLKFLLEAWALNKKPEECANSLVQIAKKHPEAVILNIEAAKALSLLKKDKEAIDLLEKSLSAFEDLRDTENSDRQFIDLVVSMGRLYGKLGEYDNGDDLFSDAMRQDAFSESFKARQAAAVFYSLRANQGEDGFFSGWTKRYFRKRLEEHLQKIESMCDKQYYQTLNFAPILRIYKKYNMPDRPEKLLLSCLLFNPDDQIARIFLAAVYFDTKQYSNSIRLLKTMADKKSDEAQFHYELGQSLLMNGNYEEAVESLELFLLVHPDNPSVLYQLGVAYFELGKYQKSIYKLEKINDYPEAKYLIAICHKQENRFKDAVEAMKAAEKIAIDKKRQKFLNKDFYLTFAFLCDKAGEFDYAVKLLKNLLEKHPEDPETCNFLGYMWADHNINLEEAERLIHTAIDNDDDNSAYLDSMAWVLYHKKHYKKALKFIEKALKIEGDLPNAVIADHAGDIYAALKMRETAIKSWSLALEVYCEETDKSKISEKLLNIQK